MADTELCKNCRTVTTCLELGCGQGRATPPSPSTAPEVFDPTKRTGRQLMDQWNAGAKAVVAAREAFEAWAKAKGWPLHRRDLPGESGEYMAASVESSWSAWQAALASRPAEVGDEGLPPLPESLGMGMLDGQELPAYSAEQYRQGQHDAVAADRARRGEKS